ncbi:unnamed protein product [Schistosoma mattheei]|uniref:Uncharacterized protein n=1 Tax=Schistosoma mattheei TaxID=31246 RepID=A0A183PIN4_9TREM|nr:unnamed protein product [Schistosoma mattheei]
MEAFTSMDGTIPLIQQTTNINYRTKVDLDATLINDKDGTASRNLEEFCDIHNDTDEDARIQNCSAAK